MTSDHAPVPPPIPPPVLADSRARSAEDRWFLLDEREFLRRSLLDAEREHEAGDLTDADHAVLVARDRSRLTEVDAELEATAATAPPVAPLESAPPVEPEPDDPIGSREWRRVGIIAACFLIVAGAVILVNHARQTRLPGQASSGSITLSGAQLIEHQLAQALVLNNEGQGVEALKEYDKVLSEDPKDPEALADAGWLKWNSGFAADNPTVIVAGRTEEEKAVRVAPTFYQGRLFLGLILFNQDGNIPGAVQQFNQFLADNPPVAIVDEVASTLIGIYTKAGVAVPAVLSSAPTTMTSTTTTTAPKTSVP